MIGRAAAALMFAALAVVPSAAGTSLRSLPIRLGVGIGPINLGMSGQQVRRALGPPGAVLERKVIRGQQYTELQWNYGDWNVGLVGRKGKRRVVLVGTALPRHRTPEGIGVGSSQGEVWRRLRAVRIRPCHRARSQWVYGRGSRETIFLPWTKPRQYDPSVPKYEVGAVEVRSAPVIGCAV